MSLFEGSEMSVRRENVLCLSIAAMSETKPSTPDNSRNIRESGSCKFTSEMANAEINAIMAATVDRRDS